MRSPRSAVSRSRCTPGECVALVGESGSGKSTLLRAFNRLTDPDAGVITVDGDDVRTLDAVALRRRIGYVPQDGGLLPHWSVLRNAALVPWLLGRQDAEAAAGRGLEKVGLSPASTAGGGRISSPAASGSAWRSPAPSPPRRASSCSTSRSAPSTRSPEAISSRCSDAEGRDRHRRPAGDPRPARGVPAGRPGGRDARGTGRTGAPPGELVSAPATPYVTALLARARVGRYEGRR